MMSIAPPTSSALFKLKLLESTLIDDSNPYIHPPFNAELLVL